MTKHEIREYAFLLLYEAMVQGIHAEETADLYATTEEMLNLPVGDRVKRLQKSWMRLLRRTASREL